MIINNNQWAISVPRKLQSSAPTLAQKGIGAGCAASRWTANDVVAVYEATRAAVERARSGKADAHRSRQLPARGSHHRHDATRYRDGAEVEAAWAREPVKRLRQFMFERDWWDEQQEQALLAEAGREVERRCRLRGHHAPGAGDPARLPVCRAAEGLSCPAPTHHRQGHAAERGGTMSDITLLEAINLALHHEMARDPDVVVLGRMWGQRRCVSRHRGLRDKFGSSGSSIRRWPKGSHRRGGGGHGDPGLKPVAEFQFQGFIFPAWSRSSARRHGCETGPVAVSPVPSSTAPLRRRHPFARAPQRERRGPVCPYPRAAGRYPFEPEASFTACCCRLFGIRIP